MSGGLSHPTVHVFYLFRIKTLLHCTEVRAFLNWTFDTVLILYLKYIYVYMYAIGHMLVNCYDGQKWSCAGSCFILSVLCCVYSVCSLTQFMESMSDIDFREAYCIRYLVCSVSQDFHLKNNIIKRNPEWKYGFIFNKTSHRLIRKFRYSKG